MADKKFKPGDIVVLNSGSTPMTIVLIDDMRGIHSCVWFDSKECKFNHHDFYASSLTAYSSL